MPQIDFNDAPEQEDDRYAWKKEAAATYVDAFEVAFIPRARVVRIAFGEYAGRKKDAFLRMAVAMPFDDAKALVEVLGEIIRDVEAEEAGDAANG